MLLKKLINSYWFIGFILYIIISPIFTAVEDYLYIAIAFIPFICLGIVLYHASKWSNSQFTKTNLFLLSLSVALFIVFCYHQLSLYVDGDQYLFSKADAVLYNGYARKLSNTDITKWIAFLSNSRYGIDDWGAFLFMGVVYSIIPSPTFLAIVYCVIGAFTALNIFYIGRSIMCRRYAFLGSLAFALSSFTIAFHGVFLKETFMIYIIILSFRYFYAYINTKKILYIILAYLAASSIFLFRTPVALIAIMAFTITFIVKNTNKILLPIILFLALGVLSTTSMYKYSYDRYMYGGDTEAFAERKNELAMGGGIVNQITDPISAFFGPFPSVVKGKNALTLLNSSGLIFRMLLVLPFIFGVYYTIRYKQLKLYPLAIFFLINAIGVAITVKGLEVRLSVPHLFAAYLIAFWWIAHYDYRRFYLRLPDKLVNIFIAGIVSMCILWNLRSFI